MKKVKVAAIIQVDKYEAFDGTRFNTEQECINYEAQFENQKSIYKAIECTDIYDPFALWDSEPDTSKLYLIKNEADYKALKAHYIADESYDYWDEPTSYPEVMVVFARDCYSVGYIVDNRRFEYMKEFFASLSSFLCKKIDFIRNQNQH